MDEKNKALKLFENMKLFQERMAKAPSSFPRRAYTATFEFQSGGKSSIVIVSCNGAGRMVHIADHGSEMGRIRTIEDVKEKKRYIVRAETKTVECWPLQMAGNSLIDEELFELSALSVGFESLGEKVVDDHRCRGWLKDEPGQRVERWFDLDTRCLVYARSTDPKGEAVEKLTSHTSESLPASEFQIPDDYVREGQAH